MNEVPIIIRITPITFDPALLKLAEAIHDPQDLNEALAAVRIEEATRRIVEAATARMEADVFFLLL